MSHNQGIDAMNNRRWATKREAAQYIGVHINTIDRWRNEGRITTHHFSEGVIRFDLDEIDGLAAADKQVRP